MNEKYEVYKEIYKKMKEKKDYISLAEKIKISAFNTKMSINKVSVYGDFYPDKYLEFIFGKATGKIIRNEKRMNYKYYFNENNQLVLTERFGKNKELIEIIFYFYNDEYTEIRIYNVNDDKIMNISKIEYEENLIKKFINVFEYVGYTETIFDFLDNKKLLLKRTSYLVFNEDNIKTDVSECIHDLD